MSNPSVRPRPRRRLALMGVAVAILLVSACQPGPGPQNLGNGDTLPSGGSLVAAGGNALVTMDPGGNLIARINGVVVWTSNTAGNPGARLVMRSQGSLAVVSSRGYTLWASPTYASGAWTQLGDDGNLVVRGTDRQPLWANGVSLVNGSRLPASQRFVSPQQVTLTKMWEGFTSGVPYNDVFQNCTVGYGHLIHLSPCTDADRAQAWDADALFAADVTEHERRLKSSLGTVPMSQREFDALWDYVFNRGSITASTSPAVYAAMTANPPRYADVPGILQANGRTLIKGLCDRRYDEAQTFAGGDYARNAVC
jgi:GH24 family phage-related lysozyme (muramidase)